ncbi:SpoIIE family protein phosphatase [Streptomyces zhihengii]
MADPSDLMRRAARVLRARDPLEMLGALTADGGLPAGRTRLWVGRGPALEPFPPAPPGDDPLDAAAREVVRTGGPRLVDTARGPALVLPLTVEDQRCGALAAGLEEGEDPYAGAVFEGLALLAESCALGLWNQARTGPLTAAMDAAAAGIFAWDFSADNVFWDERTCAVYGVDPKVFDGRGDTFFALLHPEDVPVLQAAIAQVTEAALTPPGAGVTGDPGRYRLQYRVVHPDGSVHHVTECGRVVLDDQGRPARALGVVYEAGADLPAAGRGPGAEADPSSRNSLLFTLTRALSKAVTVEDVTRVMTDVARPALGAENLLLGIMESGHLEIVGESRIAPALEHLRVPALDVMAFAATREEPLFIEDLTRHAEHGVPGLALVGELPSRSWVVLSLGSADHATGACLISFAGPRLFDAAERTFFTAVAVILTQTLERARLFDTQHQRATDLQQAMLPRRLPVLPSLSAQSRYLPGTRGMRIGGDWYDVLPLDDGTAALVIGDVQGHDAHASAVMGQLRVALRACAESGLAPGALLGKVNRVLCDLDTDRFATCAYLVLSPVDGVLRGARAGHPQPLRVRPETITEVELAGGPPLGVDPSARYPTTVSALGPLDTLLLFTDGLVERRDADIDVSVRRMMDGILDWSRGAGDIDLTALTDFLTLRDDPGRIDDVALLAVRRTP